MEQKRDEPYFNIILDSIADGVFTVDNDWKITSFNRAAEKITGVSREDAIGKLCYEVFHASICETDCALHRTMKSGKSVINKSIYIVNQTGKPFPVSISTAILRDEHGHIIGGVETFRDLREIEELRKKINKNYSFQDIISKNHRMEKIFSILPDIAESDSNVLIEGDSGTGKELIARAIHKLSGRKKKSLIVINCGALPDTLLESELFGYKAGAFTDAKKDKPGRFALAEGGTIFLDEIGDISASMQTRLLRVIQEKTYEPLGSVTACKANVRIVAATNKNLISLVEEGTFRQDLYYRLNVMKIFIPPLSERKEDIPLLVNHFIQRFNSIKGKDIQSISDEALSLLMKHNFPGNIRELENIIEHTFILCKGSIILAEHLPEQFISSHPVQYQKKSLKDMEKYVIYEALRKNNWNKKETAKELGIDKTTLWRKIKLFGIENNM
ncbi:MAG: sigma 54-interacting transcriptional regulator [Candidatus Eremiobacterota bacterium]